MYHKTTNSINALNKLCVCTQTVKCVFRIKLKIPIKIMKITEKSVFIVVSVCKKVSQQVL